MQNERWLRFVAGKWREENPAQHVAATRFRDIRYFYSNLIDYFRIALCFAAAAAIYGKLPVLAAVLLLLSTLLDWVDGPVARARNESTIFGSGIDWLADILAQVVTILWWISLAPELFPVLLIALSIEISACVFDFATTASGRYPVLVKQGGFGTILDWCMPGGSYTWFGTFLWLAYPVFSLLVCVDLSLAGQSTLVQQAFFFAEAILLLPAILYLWCELACFVFILKSWHEPVRSVSVAEYDDGPAGVALLGSVPVAQARRLADCLAELKETLKDEWRASAEKREIFWINLWQKNANSPTVSARDKDAIRAWSEELGKTSFDGERVYFDGCGFIVNPVGSAVQPWHLDYSEHYATLFIPMTKLTPQNSLQYVWLQETKRAYILELVAKNPDVIEADILANESGFLNIRQLIAPPLSLIRMDFGAIHRGVANTGDFERIMFFASYTRRGAIAPTEPTIARIRYGL